MILSIESSCDDTSIAITEIKNAKLLFHTKISQETIHSTYGGVVPEIASRLHAQELPNLLAKAKKFLNDSLSPIKAIAITTQPGLSVTLIEGLVMAKALSLCLNIPLISINHLKGHIFSLFIDKKESIFPLTTLLVSGGHTMIIESESPFKMSIKAQSLDDSFGESFDKVSKMLSLGYPGGPIVEKYALNYQGDLIPYPLPLRHFKEIAFSFSGLKNAVRLSIEKILSINEYIDEKNRARICASFQQVAINHLFMQLQKYFVKQIELKKPIKDFCIVGGASANLVLREKITQLCKAYNVKLHLPSLEFCSDNAAMIGRYAIEKYNQKLFSNIYSLQALPKSSIEEFIS